eukprot:scaffold248530_cov106-Cyclotella_meneghiniana.AAC.1
MNLSASFALMIANGLMVKVRNNPLHPTFLQLHSRNLIISFLRHPISPHMHASRSRQQQPLLPPRHQSLRHPLLQHYLILLLGKDSGKELSVIDIPFDNIPSPAECSALCSDVDYFYHPSLVGFTTGITASGRPQCLCHYTGGTVPSIPPPKNMSYVLFARDGNGPVMTSASPYTLWKCYAYAQGTGSPTTPGATNHPITPSPTGSITSAPTPVGIASWNKIGSGYCTDSNNDRYSAIQSQIPTPADCAQFCHKLPSPYLVGFVHGTGVCSCLYSGQNVPTPPSGIGIYSIDTERAGTGPIGGSDAATGKDCYAFAQGTAAPVTSTPTNTPVTSTPTNAASSYTLVGNGL